MNQETIKIAFELIGGWLVVHGLKIILILVAATLAWKYSSIVIEKAVRRFISSQPGVSKLAEEKRENTLIRVFAGTSKVLVLVLGGLMVLAEIGINVTPLLAAAGVAGLAFGFGGQYLIRDIISGLFIILENQYRVGDIVSIGDKSGIVESINLRLTVIRDLDGIVHYVPNGEIKIASNFTREFSRVNINIRVSYSSDMEKVIKVVNEVGEEMANDPEWKDKIVSAPKFLRVDEFGDSSVNIKILGDTAPSEQWGVAGEYRKRIKAAFDKAGIEIPFPQRVIHTSGK